METTKIRHISFNGSGYVAFDNKLVKHDPSFVIEISLDFSTASSEGLLLWQGSRAQGSGFFDQSIDANYIAVAGLA